jgi:hypothetical protein
MDPEKPFTAWHQFGKHISAAMNTHTTRTNGTS